jgi:serine/threonine protein kinase
MTRTDPLIGEQLGDYKIISLLGKGGMARVYRGFDPKLERFAAVKVIDKGLAQPEYGERFRREARAIAKLEHPRIVHVYQFGETEDVYYMAMVFIDGRDLAHLIREARAQDQLIPIPRAMRIISDMAEALDYAHEHGVIHRDVKPSNVMVTPEGRGVLTDFGLALSVNEGTIGSTFGTAHYIAPEQAVSSANAVPQSDQYSLGVVAYQLLTGRVPFDDPGITNIVLKHLNQTPAPPSSVNPLLPAGVDNALMRALEKSPEARYPNCRALVTALEEVLLAEERRRAEAAFLEDWDAPPLPRGALLDTDVDRPTTLSIPSIPSAVETDAEPASTAPLLRSDPPPTPSRPSAPKARSTGEMPAAAPQRAPAPVQRRRSSALAPVLIASGVIGLIAVIGAILIAAGASELLKPALIAAALTETPTTAAARAAELAVGLTETAVLGARAAADTPTPTPTDTPVPTQTHTPTPTPTATPTPTPTDTPTPTPTATPTPTPTDTPTPAPTDTPTSTPTPTLTAAVDQSSAAPFGERMRIALVYDGSGLVLYNRGETAVDVSGWEFVQVDTLIAGEPVSYTAAQWGSSGVPLRMLRPGECLQLWQITLGQPPLPPECAETRMAWRSVGQRRWFWIGAAGGETFEVRSGTDVLATCPTAPSGSQTALTCWIP